MLTKVATFEKKDETQELKTCIQILGPSCIYVALACPKSVAGHFPQSEEQLIWDQLVCFITVALELLSTPS